MRTRFWEEGMTTMPQLDTVSEYILIPSRSSKTLPGSFVAKWRMMQIFYFAIQFLYKLYIIVYTVEKFIVSL